MRESWYALALAILAPRPLYPEEALDSFSDGKLVERDLSIIVPDMTAIHRLGEDRWQDIAEMFGYNSLNARTVVSRWKRKQRLKAR